jgi:L-asparaginase
MIAILFTGGTMSMKIDAATGAAVPALDGREILAAANIREGDVAIEDFSRLPGPHVTPEQMWRLARRAAAWLERPDIDGLVVTHGTDTLEETAYFLDLVLLSAKPVVLVGAIKTISEPSWDGPANLIAAVRVASSPASRNRGTLVVMNEQILAAAEAQKVHAEASTSFSSHEFGPLGALDAGSVVYRRRQERPAMLRDLSADEGLRVVRIEPHVDLLTAVTGMDDRFFRCSLESGARGIVIEAMGRGNLPPAAVPGVAACIAAGLPVVIVSRALAGRVLDRYGYEGGGRELHRLGAIFGGDLSGPKARIKLMVALGLTRDVGRLRAIFESP